MILSPRRGEYPTPEASGEGGWFTPKGAEGARAAPLGGRQPPYPLLRSGSLPPYGGTEKRGQLRSGALPPYGGTE